MRKLYILLSLLLFIASINPKSALAASHDGNKSSSAKSTWSRWILSSTSNIYYRIEMQDATQGAAGSEIRLEFLNSYRKPVSFCFALNDNGNLLEIKYRPIFQLKKNKSTVVTCPRPEGNQAINVSITSVELGK